MTTILLVGGAAIAMALVAFFRAVWRRKGDSPIDTGTEFASFLKITALIIVAVLAVASIKVIPAGDKDTLTALFTLFGAIAGYVAGTKADIETQPVADQDDDEVKDGAGGKPKPTVRRSVRRLSL